MSKPKVTICDDQFLPFGARAMGLDGERLGESPQSFEWEAADAQNARFVTDSHIKDARGHGQVAWMLEPPALHPENYQTLWERRHEFDYILAHSQAWEWGEGCRWYPHGGSRIKPEHWGQHPKTRDISMICGPKDSLPGHKLRLLAAERFGSLLDVYHDNYNKLETLVPYRFSVVFENERSPHFFTEKLIDCLAVGTVPIYWGATESDLDQYILHFSRLDDLGELLGDLTSCKVHYPFYMRIKDFDVLQAYACAEDWIHANYPEVFHD